jgi:acyl-[acyl-carrier-protein]-phospholipid O-acyltransferase/long-chain-fatty-acid--[acyl-carrier-protein] ligase
MKTCFRFLLRVLYRFRAYDLDALKTPGPVLLIPNHCSWLDWLFLWVCLDDDWKFVTSSVAAQRSWVHRKVMINRYTLSIDTNSPYVVKRMAEFLKGGGRLVLFAEGRLSRTGTLMKLFDGTGFLIFKTKAKVITPAVFPQSGLEEIFSQGDRPFQRRAGCARIGGHQHHSRTGAADELASRPSRATTV